MPSLSDSLMRDGSIATLEAAAPWRRRDAEVLESARRLDAAIYLYGYVAEIRITAACYRLKRFEPTAPIGRADRASLEKEARQLHMMSSEPHDLAGWARFLIYVRQRDAQGYSRALRTDLTMHVEGLYEHWRPRLRYRALTPSEAQMKPVRDAVEWLGAHYSELWS